MWKIHVSGVPCVPLSAPNDAISQIKTLDLTGSSFMLTSRVFPEGAGAGETNLFLF